MNRKQLLARIAADKKFVQWCQRWMGPSAKWAVLTITRKSK